MVEDPYVYPGTQVLRNRFAIHNPDELARREHDASTARQLELQANPLPGRYDLEHLQAFHRHIFGDLYPWAGEIRTVTIAKGDLFALPKHIKPYLTEVLGQLPAENFLRGLQREPAIDRLTHYVAEINSVHPFREGNGRVQRAFIGQLAQQAGYRIAWGRLEPQRNIDASQAAHRGNNEPLRAVLHELTEPMPRTEEVKRLIAAAFPRPLPATRTRARQHPAPPPAARRAERPGRKPRHGR
jgi:cell filamentation protein